MQDIEHEQQEFDGETDTTIKSVILNLKTPNE